MSIKKGEIARCGACRFYTPIGRRGGECSQLAVPVQSVWKTCSLSESPFQEANAIDTSDIALAKIATEKQIASEALPMPAGRFAISEKQLVVRLPQ